MRFGTEAMLSEYEVHSRQPTDHLVQQHLPLVKRLASQLAVKLPSHIEIEDLIQVGLIGLLKAVDDYQSDSGAVFSTYATIRIRGAMLDELRGRDWLPRSVQRDLGRVAAAIDRELPLWMLDPDPFVELAKSPRLGRFSRYWREAEPVVWEVF